MAKQTPSTSANKSQLERFKQTAREVETEDSEEVFDRVLRRVAPAPANGSDKVGKERQHPKK